MRKPKFNFGKTQKHTEEVDDILTRVMCYVDSFLEGDDFDKSEVERAAIMHRKVTKLLDEKDTRMDNMKRDMQRKQFFSLIGR